MTEAEALKRWCPFTRLAGSTGAFNRARGEKLLPEGTMCIGSLCMAWRGDGCGLVSGPSEPAKPAPVPEPQPGAPAWQRM
jgi:hypothetical protein